ncbi:MAG: thiamine pyrophosphate-binding protein [Rhodocyclales bacterium]|nr:thiamine pyrophosphate-binding protein [Rhodocyclales bacterium]
MKLSDYIARFLAERGIRHVFAVSGGASLHLIHSLDAVEGITFVCPQHEQAGAMAADGYARTRGAPGAAVATSGPGATNLITGICGCYYDSVPVLFLTGQVATFRMAADTGVRQIGFQETPILDLCRPITNYAVQIGDPSRIRYELEKAWHLATHGRPGPVLIDVPDNVQRMEIDPQALTGFVPPQPGQGAFGGMAEALPTVRDWLRASHRPVVVAGWGLHLAGVADAFRAWVEALRLPVAPTWGAADILPAGHPLYVGTFGTHGCRHANFAVQNADLIISLGSRLDTKSTGSPITTFARGARKVVVDIDADELRKFAAFGLHIDLPVQDDLREALPLLAGLDTPCDSTAWLQTIAGWRAAYPVCPREWRDEVAVNPYVLVERLSELLPAPCNLYIDTGCGIAWMMQAFRVRTGQRLFHDFNNTAMGWALPAAIGGRLADPATPVVCVSGDGSLLMNIQELATAARHALPLKLVLLNNGGYAMIQQTQDQWLGSRYLASSVEGGLAFPDFDAVARGFGWEVRHLRRNDQLQSGLRDALALPGPVLINVEIPAAHRVTPQVKFGRPNEDSEPLLPRGEFLANMIVPALEVSQKE